MKLMDDVLHIRIKKDYASKLISQLLEDNAIEEIEDEPIFSDERMQLIREERQKYLKQEGASYSWNEVKQMAISKQKPNGI